MKTVYYVAASLDGFIADADEGVDWLDQLNIDSDTSAISAFMDTVDGLLMGRKTYDFVFNYGQWPYGDRPTWVCTNRDISAMDGCNLQDARSPHAAIQQAKEREISALWVVGGGQLAGELIREKLLTHISVSVMPVLLGSGVPLVDFLPEHLHLHQEAATSMSGFTQVDYRIQP